MLSYYLTCNTELTMIYEMVRSACIVLFFPYNNLIRLLAIQTILWFRQIAFTCPGARSLILILCTNSLPSSVINYSILEKVLRVLILVLISCLVATPFQGREWFLLTGELSACAGRLLLDVFSF